MKTSSATPAPHLLILGGGLAGLAAGHYARLRGIPCTILEADEAVGGMCRTVRIDGFSFDLGAHRFHDKDPDITRDVLSLLDGRIGPVSLPSHIWYQGRFVRFPPSFTDLVGAVGVLEVLRSAGDMLAAKRTPVPEPASFEDTAIRSYGRPIASRFLLNYSSKLWGTPCSRLSPRVSGGRLSGLDVRSAVLSAVRGSHGRVRHVDGSFYYPHEGIGDLVRALAESCGPSSIRTNARVREVRWDGGRVTGIRVNDSELLRAEHVISTLPLPVLARLMSPPLGGLELSRLRLRHLRLVALLLDRPSVTRSATVYFPDPGVPFTRVYEPRNRSPRMSPEGRTSVVAEVPCSDADRLWTCGDEEAIEVVTAGLLPLGWFDARDIRAATTTRVHAAYPIIDLDAEAEAQRARRRLEDVRNLTLAGRAGRFEYAWIHNLLRQGRELAERIAASGPARSRHGL